MKKFLSLVLALIMTMSLVTIGAGAADFTDAADVDYAEAVEVLTATGIVSGYTDGSVRPDVALNRGQAAKIICNMILGPTAAAALPTSVAPYADVPAGSTFAGYIAYLAKEGLVSGYADGSFQPTAPLTGYAFMKMLLGVIGYDSAIEGYTGSNWAVSVAKQALAVGLNKGLADTFVGNKTVTRQEAMLYAFNALKAKYVEYETKGANITIGGVVINTGASEAKVNSDVAGGKTYYAKLFDGDLRGYADNDVYGRPATTWYFDNTKVGTFAKKADAVYTANAKLYQVKTDLGLNTTDAHNFYWTENLAGGQSTGYAGNFPVAATTSASTTKLNDFVAGKAGNGVTVEFFYDPDVAGYNEIVYINEYIDDIDMVDEDDDGRFVTLGGGIKFYTEDFADDQWVLYTVGETYATKAASVKAAEKLTGTITKTEDDGTYFIDGVAYDLNKNFGNPGLLVGSVVDFYLDSAGYIIKMDTSSLSAALEDLAMVYASTADTSWTQLAKVVYGTGKVEVVTLKDAATPSYVVYNFTNASEKLKVESSVGYTSTDNGAASSYTKGAVQMDGVNVDAKTTFIYLNTSKDTTSVYTGTANAPSFGSAAKVVSYKKDTAAAAMLVIVIDAAGISNATNALTYVLADDNDLIITEKNAAGDRYSYYDVKTIGGENLKVATGSYAALAAQTAYGTALVDTMTIDGNGVATISAVYTAGSPTDASTGSVSSTVKVSNGILYVDGVAVMAVSDDLVVYTVAADGETFTKGDANSVIDYTGRYVGYTVVEAKDDNVITTLVLKKA